MNNRKKVFVNNAITEKIIVPTKKAMHQYLPNYCSYRQETVESINRHPIIPMTASAIQEGVKALAMAKRVEAKFNSQTAPAYIVDQAKRIVTAIKPEVEPETQEFAKLVEQEINTLMKFHNRPKNLYM